MLTLRNVGGCLSPPEIAVSGCKVTNINCKPKAPAKKILRPAKYPTRDRVVTPRCGLILGDGLRTYGIGGYARLAHRLCSHAATRRPVPAFPPVPSAFVLPHRGTPAACA